MQQSVTHERPSTLDILDRVLTKGIVIFYGETMIMSLETYVKQTAASAEDETIEAVVSAAEKFLRDLPGEGAPHFSQH